MFRAVVLVALCASVVGETAFEDVVKSLNLGQKALFDWMVTTATLHSIGQLSGESGIDDG